MFGAGAVMVLTPDAAVGAAVQGGRGLPRGRPHARPGGREPRPRARATRRATASSTPTTSSTTAALVGELLFWATRTLFQEVGRPHPLRLPAGRGRAAAHRRVGRRRGARDARSGVTQTTARLRRSTQRVRGGFAGASRRPQPAASGPSRADAARGRARRARHARRGARRWTPPSEDPDLYGRGSRSPRTSRTSARAGGRPSPSRRPRTRPRAGGAHPDGQPPLARSPRPTTSTGSPPSRALLKRSSGKQKVDRAARRRGSAAQLVEALGHFGVEAQVVGHRDAART